MPDERTIVETIGRRRLVREYSAEGKLLQLRLEPLATPPPDEPHALRAVEKTTPTPLDDALAKADATMAAQPLRFKILSATPIPAREPPPEKTRKTLPPERAPEAVAARPEPMTSPSTLAIEELPVILEPYTAPIAPPPAPPVSTAPAAPTPITVLRARRRILALHFPQPAARLHVPDLQRRVDDIITRKPRAKPRPARRARIDAPQFAPIRREPWEERLDKILREKAKS